jgi:biopolymer transport protein TolR
MMFEARQRRFMAEINVIPLVDVVLVLLVIFMVTAPMLYRGMDINLPKSATNTIKPEMRTVLTIEKDQRLYLDKDPIGVAQLEQKLKNLKHEHSDVSLYLRADRDVPYGIVVQVMDGVKKAGIEKIGMVTEPVGPERVGGAPIPRAPSRKS